MMSSLHLHHHDVTTMCSCIDYIAYLEANWWQHMTAWWLSDGYMMADLMSAWWQRRFKTWWQRDGEVMVELMADLMAVKAVRWQRDGRKRSDVCALADRWLSQWQHDGSSYGSPDGKNLGLDFFLWRECWLVSKRSKYWEFFWRECWLVSETSKYWEFFVEGMLAC